MPVISLPSTQRLVKTLVQYEADLAKEDKPFFMTVAGILKKDLKTHLLERSSFIILNFLEKESLQGMFTK